MASPDDLMALAIGVLRRRIARHWRRVRRESPCDAAILQRDAIPAPRRSAEHGPAEMASARDQLRSMTADLAAADRLLVEMRVEGFCTAEIAERLGCSEGAIRARLSRLRERLRVTGYRDGP
ncbi:MAG: sigma-70 region 4 domain-containing protein [Pirellulaceae bacterium]|nr:sigma-70 region 4 domain-containing protein [Pirellulaceae bacterium]